MQGMKQRDLFGPLLCGAVGRKLLDSGAGINHLEPRAGQEGLGLFWLALGSENSLGAPW